MTHGESEVLVHTFWHPIRGVESPFVHGTIGIGRKRWAEIPKPNKSIPLNPQSTFKEKFKDLASSSKFLPPPDTSIQDMRHMTVEGTTTVVLTVLVVILVSGLCQARPRRFCENYPFAPRCLGVAAKRHELTIDTDKSILHDALDKSFSDSDDFDLDEDDKYSDLAEKHLLGRLKIVLKSLTQRAADTNSYRKEIDDWLKLMDTNH
ncbi:hypothetical protein ScPMuIL_015774 [Solemya velum]